MLMSETGSMGLSSSSIAGEKVVRSRLFSSANYLLLTSATAHCNKKNSRLMVICTRWELHAKQQYIHFEGGDGEGTAVRALTKDGTEASRGRRGDEVETHVDGHGQRHGHDHERRHRQCPVPERKQSLRDQLQPNAPIRFEMIYLYICTEGQILSLPLISEIQVSFNFIQIADIRCLFRW
jgi:hypothetical protein